MTKVNIPTVKLNNGLNMPVIGYGTWMGLNDKGKFINEDVPKMKTALSYAIDIGYRHIDTAHLYRVEPEVGEIINKKIQEKVVKREELFVVTKVWNTFHKEKDVEASVRASLKRLNLDYLDSVLMHWPISFKETGEDEHIDYLETWRGLENVFKAGLVKSIGVSNFNVEQLKRLLANAHVVPVCNQVEINFNLGQNELVDYCKSKNIVVVAYSPFGTMVPSRSVPDSPEPKLNNPTLVAIAKKHNKTPTQIALKYLVQRGIVAIPKTVTNARVLENASIFDFTLDQGDVQTLAKFDNGFRTVRPVFWQNHQNYPFDKVALDKVPEIPEALRVWKNGALANID